MQRKLWSLGIAAWLGTSLAVTGHAQVVDIPAATLPIPTPIPSTPGGSPANGGLQPPRAAAPPTATVPGATPPGATTPATPSPLVDLPTDPNAPIDELAPPPLAAPSMALAAGALGTALGPTAGSFSAAPTMMGDLFGGGFSVFRGSQTIVFDAHAPGTIVSGGPGATNSVIAFELGNDLVPNDIFTTGLGQDSTNAPDGADTFAILEPIPPSDAPTAPGLGFTFDGGTAVYTDSVTQTDPQPGVYNDGDIWYIKYSYTGAINNPNGGIGGARDFIPVPGPGISARRVKISENFSPEVRDRFFTNFSFFNDAYGGLGDISRYVLGTERVLVEDLISIEARLPMAGTYSSYQAIDQAESRGFELGNAGLIAKGVLLRADRFLVSGGLGITLPIADDTRLANNGNEILRIENETVHIMPYMATLVRLGQKTLLQAFMQFDVAANGDPVLANLLGGPLQELGTFHDSTLVNIDVALNRQLYTNRRGGALRSVTANTELHYTGTLEDSDIVASNGLEYTNLKNSFNVVNATFGFHLQFGDRFVVTPAMAVPLRDGLDEQFDYEALVQLNYLR